MKAFDKRDGSGQYNWGTAQDELAARYVYKLPSVAELCYF